jgi:hypothetical protein
MNPINTAKSMLPNMPDEVFNTWLFPIIRDHKSWPYCNISASHPSCQWSQYFGLFTLNDIANCLWHKISLTFDMGCLDPITNKTIDTLIQKHVHNLDSGVKFNVRNSKNRFLGFVELIKRKGSIPPPIIGINTDNGLRILDGNHRIAALTYLNYRGRIQCTTWVGAPNV